MTCSRQIRFGGVGNQWGKPKGHQRRSRLLMSSEAGSVKALRFVYFSPTRDLKHLDALNANQAIRRLHPRREVRGTGIEPVYVHGVRAFFRIGCRRKIHSCGGSPVAAVGEVTPIGKWRFRTPPCSTFPTAMSVAENRLLLHALFDFGRSEHERNCEKRDCPNQSRDDGDDQGWYDAHPGQ